MNNEILSYNDIRTRLRSLESIEVPSKYNIRTLYENIFEKYNFQNAKIITENWKELDQNENTCFDMIMELFNYVCEVDTPDKIDTLASIIESRLLHKFRNGKQLRHLNNYKLGKFKIPNTKVNKRSVDNATAISRALANKGHVGNSLHPNRKYEYDIFGKRRKAIDDKEDSSSDNTKDEKKNENDKENTKKETAKNEAYDMFTHVLDVNCQCDRVLKNHNNITKRFNIENTIRETAMCPTIESIQDSILELCKLIDSYDIEFGIKYNVALEEAFYLFHKNCIDISNSILAETVSDYFIMTRNCDDNVISDMKYIIENNHFYTDEDVSGLRYIYETTNNGQQTVKESEYLADMNIDSIVNESKKDVNAAKDKKNNTKGIIAGFKKAKDKSVGLFKSCISRIFMNSPYNIVHDLPDIFSFTRTFLEICVTGWQPAVGIPLMVTNFFIKNTIRRKESHRVIEEYKKNKTLYENKAQNAKNDKDRDKYLKMVENLDKSISKMQDYERSLYTDKENEERDAKEYNESFDLSTLSDILMISSLTESMDYNKNDIMNSIKSNITSFCSEDIYTITESVMLCPEVFDTLEYSRILENELKRYRADAKSDTCKFIRIDALKECIYEVNNKKYDDIVTEADEDNLPDTETVFVEMKLMKELVDDTMELINFKEDYIVFESNNDNKKKDVAKKEHSKEATNSIRNKINSVKDKIANRKKLSLKSRAQIAGMKGKEVAHKVMDKDRQISDTIDSNVSSVKNSIKKALVAQNREQIIKGSMMPSASKTIKYAIAGGIGLSVAPVLTIITAIGGFAKSKSLKAKERQIILDEIEVEIDYCDRQLRYAEEKNDLKAIRQIMQIKRNLQRQQQQIKYHMAVTHNEKIPNKVKNTNDLD